MRWARALVSGRVLAGAVALGMEGYGDRFSLERVRLGACLVLRHDLDGLDAAGIERLACLEGGEGVRSTCFVLADQLVRCAEAVDRLRHAGWDVQLHTQPRGLALEVVDLRWIEWRYRRRLRRAHRRWARRGWSFAGHAPHGVHCHLGVDPDTDWDVIENATVGSGFAWLSSYRAVVKTGPGQEFPLPACPYFRRDTRIGARVLVMPTVWDDRYFGLGWEARWMGRGGRTIAEAQASVLRQLAVCQESDMPCLVSLHPGLWQNGAPGGYQWSFERWLVETCRRQGVPVRTLASLAVEVGT